MQAPGSDLPPLPSLESLIGPDGNIPRSALSQQLRVAMAAAAASGMGASGGLGNLSQFGGGAAETLAALQGVQRGASTGSSPMLSSALLLGGGLLGGANRVGGVSMAGLDGGGGFGARFGGRPPSSVGTGSADLTANIMEIMAATEEAGGEFADMGNLVDFGEGYDEFSSSVPPHSKLLPGSDLRLIAFAEPPHRIVSMSAPMLRALGLRTDELDSGACPRRSRPSRGRGPLPCEAFPRTPGALARM
jgi:hypothetical protein